MRIGRILSQLGLCSRRGAHDFIKENKVEINGELITEINHQVEFKSITDLRVKINGQNLKKSPGYRVFLFNKPVGFVCSHKEQNKQKSIFRVLPDELAKFFYAGRLDTDSCGLMLLSNDGDLIHRLSHPSEGVEKEYLLHCSRPLSKEEMAKAQKGVFSRSQKLKLDKISRLGPAQYRVIINHGKNREIRRVLEKFGVKAVHLQRTALGPFELGHLKEGNVLELDHNESLGLLEHFK